MLVDFNIRVWETIDRASPTFPILRCIEDFHVCFEHSHEQPTSVSQSLSLGITMNREKVTIKSSPLASAHRRIAD
jgi:hypothetical protein